MLEECGRTESLLVTILTVSYNSEKTIAKTIDAVFHQTYPNIEYVIIDSASTDGTADVARSFQSQFDATQGRSLTVISEPDDGMYDALNKGAHMSHGELVGQTNADDWYEPDAVEIMANLYEERHYDLAWGSVRIHKSNGTAVKKAKIDPLWTSVGWCHPAAFSRRETLLENPYGLHSLYDDFEYMLSLRAQGKKLLTTDRLISNFSFGGMSTKKSLAEARERAKMRYKIYQRFHFPKVYFVHCCAIEMTKFVMG